jgi:hypothetical protein
MRIPERRQPQIVATAPDAVVAVGDAVQSVLQKVLGGLFGRN